MISSRSTPAGVRTVISSPSRALRSARAIGETQLMRPARPGRRARPWSDYSSETPSNPGFGIKVTARGGIATWIDVPQVPGTRLFRSR
jgi:hypothetical protein